MSVTVINYLYVGVDKKRKWKNVGDVFTNPDYKPDKPIDETNKPKRSYYTWQYIKMEGHPLNYFIERVCSPGWPEYADIPGRGDPSWRHRDEWWQHEYYGWAPGLLAVLAHLPQLP